MTQSMLEALAKGTAYALRVDHQYLPQNLKEMQEFEVHAWVIAAMRRAYEYGREDQRADTDRNQS